MNPADIRLCNGQMAFPKHRYRTPIKFGGVAVDRARVLHVRLDVETRSGKRATGYGSMPLGNIWAFPSALLTYDETADAMLELAQDIFRIYRTFTDYAHPIDITHTLEPEFFRQAERTRARCNVAEPIPRLATLVCASAFDAALHDAYGKANGLPCAAIYGPDHLKHDLGHYLGKDFTGLRLHDYLLPHPKETMPLYHLVGALDPLTPADIVHPIGDGLPETLGEWIRRDGLTHLKIKLNGDDLRWDVERVLGVDAVAAEVQAERAVAQWFYSLDFNERCPNVGYLIDVLRTIQQRNHAAFARIQYIEQPTKRDLHADRANVMHEAAKLRPIVIDESLTDLESLLLAREMGYTGAALKACKGQTQSLLMAAAAQRFGMFLCVQDLTCPNASLIQSAWLAAHVPGVAAIEANARQYMPAANDRWVQYLPGLFEVRNGRIATGTLTGPGFGGPTMEI